MNPSKSVEANFKSKANNITEKWIQKDYSWSDIDKMDKDIAKALKASFNAGLDRAEKIAKEYGSTCGEHPFETGEGADYDDCLASEEISKAIREAKVQ